MSRRMTRAVAVTAAIAVGTAMLAACGDDSSEASGEIEGAITYGFWGTPARAEKVEAIAELFAAQHPGASVTGEVADYTAYIERLTVRAAGGDLPCATGTQSTFLAQYAQNGALRPLDDLIESGQIDISGISEDVIAAGQIGGEQFMIPTGTFVRLMAYNADLVSDAGVAEPTDDMTWEEYANWLAELQPELPEGVYAGENEGGNMFTFSSWVIGHGAEMFTEDNQLGFDKQVVVDYFQYWLDLAEEGVVLPASRIDEQSGALELTPLATGDVAAGTRDIPHMYITQSALAGAGLPSTIEAVSIPSQDPAQSANILGSNGISIPESCDNVATAAAWIDLFANDTEAALAFQSDNGILTNVDAQNALLEDEATPEGVKQNVRILQGLTDSGDLTTSRYPAGLSTITNELLRLYQSAAFGEMSVEAAADAFLASAEEALG